MGYSRAGFEVVGVDINPQPRYPFEFHQADAMEYPLNGFEVIHASPPCQAYSAMQRLNTRSSKVNPDLIAPVRKRLQAAGVPYVMENVPEAPLFWSLTLCGSSFGLGVRRHRRFETSHLLMGLPCRHGSERPIAVYGAHPQRHHTPGAPNRAWTLEVGREAMGINWMEWRELCESIPPAYTEWIGTQLLRVLGVAA